MTRADMIRWVAAQFPELTASELADLVAARGFNGPSRQAIESALAKSGTRGRPTERARCPLCASRVAGDPFDLVRLMTAAETLELRDEINRVWQLRKTHPAVADVSQTPKTKRTKRKGAASKS